MTKDGRYVYVTNFGDSTISSYTIGGDGSLALLEPVAAFEGVPETVAGLAAR